MNTATLERARHKSSKAILKWLYSANTKGKSFFTKGKSFFKEKV